MPPRTIKVAVVGSGLAGLTAAHLLSVAKPKNDNVEFEVHLFEKAPSLGMDAHSTSIPILGNTGKSHNIDWRVDVPMRSFQGGYYPRLIAFYKYLGVKFEQRDYTYSFSILRTPTSKNEQDIETTFIYNGASGRDGVSVPSHIRQRLWCGAFFDSLWKYLVFVVTTLLFAFNYIKLLLLSAPVFRSDSSRTEIFEQWVSYNTPRSALARWIGLDTAWERFAVEVLVPLFSAVCTAPDNSIWQHPVEEFLDYIWLTLGTHHYVVTGSVCKAVERLARHVRHIHLDSPLSSLRPDTADPRLTTITAAGKTYEGFTHVVFATQANTAVPLLKGYAEALPKSSPTRTAVEEQVEHLSTFEYAQTIVVNHTDESLLPQNPADRRDLNLFCWDPSSPPVSEKDTSGLCLPRSYAMATHVVPRPKGLPEHVPNVYQTTNPTRAPAPNSVLSVAHMQRAVLAPSSKAARSAFCEEVPTTRRWWECAAQAPTRLGRAQGAGVLRGDSTGPGIWICGSYAYVGIPLLEGCVVSARLVAEGIFACEGLDVEGEPW